MTEDDIAEGRELRPTPYLANFLVTIGRIVISSSTQDQMLVDGNRPAKGKSCSTDGIWSLG